MSEQDGSSSHMHAATSLAGTTQTSNQLQDFIFIFTPTMLALISISVYLVLNLLITYSNRSIIAQTSSPYLLTAGHALASYVSTVALSKFQTLQPSSPHNHRQTTIKVLCFSVLFTVNITLSNYTLNLVSLPIHQTIRATAPALTIATNVYLELRTWSSYDRQTYLSLLPIISGVILAANGGRYEASLFGLVLTFAGAVTAVLKTIATNFLQTHLDMRPIELVRHTAPLAVVQSLVMAYYCDELTNIAYLPRLRSLATGESWSWTALNSLAVLMIVNACLAAALNLISFDASRRCGPVSMGVAANVKQVIILVMPYMTSSRRNSRWQVLIGGMMTVVGGVWYTSAQRREKLRGAGSREVDAEGQKLSS
jgi:hypothetical protein